MNKLHTDDVKKWMPRNKQAALVVRPARDYDRPPLAPRFAESLKDKLAAESKIRQELIAKLESESRHSEARLKLNASQEKAIVAKCKWAKKVLRAIHARKGLPKPTIWEVRAYAKDQTIFGTVVAKPIFKSNK